MWVRQAVVVITIESSSVEWLVPTFVAILALLFTVASFWWMNARRGRLVSYAPHSFAGANPVGSSSLIRLPLVLYNTGATPIVVQDLRLVLESADGSSDLVLPWAIERAELKPHKDDGHQMPAVFSVGGRTADRRFIEFALDRDNPPLQLRAYVARAEARIGRREGWTQIVSFVLYADQIIRPEQFLSYRNGPSSGTAG